MPFALAGAGEGLAGTGAGPNRSIVGPSGHAQGVAPDADACEEVALGESAQVVVSDILDAPWVDFARGDQAGLHEIAQPLHAVVVILVVVRGLHVLSSGVSSR